MKIITFNQCYLATVKILFAVEFFFNKVAFVSQP